MPRTRTTKKLAQRIDLDYFKRANVLTRWEWWLSIAAVAAFLAWIGVHFAAGDRRVYSAGSLAPAHAVLTRQCSACHLSELGFFRAQVSDAKCEACHDGSMHHASQLFTPACASCHADHRGAVRLAATSDENCTRCHANLSARDGAVQFTRTITSFEKDHPEFAILRSRQSDPGMIELNHYRHLQPNLLGPNGSRVQMTCTDCHRSAADANGAWPYGDEKTRAGAPANQTVSNESSNGSSAERMAIPAAASRAYMAPPTYVRTCAGCHGLQFDTRLADAVPHDKPEVIHPFLLAKLQAYIAAHPSELRVPRDPSRDLPEKPVAADYRLLTPAQWVAERTTEDEQLLWRKTCKQCHTLIVQDGAALPQIAPSNITSRYLPHANFDHSQHGLVDCTACHAAAKTSQQRTDLLLPGIATCRTCHHPGSESAESRCFECHTYHDPAQRKPVHSSFALAQM